MKSCATFNRGSTAEVFTDEPPLYLVRGSAGKSGRRRRRPSINNIPSEGLQVSVKGPGTTSLTYDKNGNLTGDGTNSYKFDAENQMIEIDYSGSGNKSLFAYDGYGRNIQILEYSGGSLASTKNFVWCGSDRCEARDATSAVTAQYFSGGETLGATSYYFTGDHLGLTDADVMPFDQLAHLQLDRMGTLQASTLWRDSVPQGK